MLPFGAGGSADAFRSSLRYWTWYISILSESLIQVYFLEASLGLRVPSLERLVSSLLLESAKLLFHKSDGRNGEAAS